MNENELANLFAQAQDAFRNGELDKAESLFRQVMEQAAEEVIEQQAELYLLHVRPDNRQLLMQIAAEREPGRRVELVDRALSLGLVFGLVEEQALSEIKAAALLQQRVIADDRARKRLEYGEQARQRGSWDEAATAYAEAASFAHLSPDVQAEAERRLKQLAEDRQKYDAAERLLDEIPALLESADVTGAEARLERSRQSVISHPRLNELQEKVSTARDRINGIEQATRQASQALKERKIKAAEMAWMTAMRMAEEANWTDWSNRAGQGLEEARRQSDTLLFDLHEKRREGEGFVRQAEEAYTLRDLSQALSLAGQAVRTLKEADVWASDLELTIEERQPVSDLLEQADRIRKRCEALDLAHKYLAGADFDGATRQLAVAETLGGSDDFTRGFRDKIASQQLRAETLKRTLAQRQTDYHSPSEMIRELESYPQLFGDSAPSRQSETRKLYWSQAAADLRSRVQAIMGRLERGGQLLSVLKDARDAHKEWNEYFSPIETERQRDPSTWPENRALVARLAILDEQVRHLTATEAAARQFETALVALHQESSVDGVDAYQVQQGQEIWLWLQGQHSPVQHHLLRGYTRFLVDQIFPPLRRQAQKMESTLAEGLELAVSHLSINQPALALDTLKKYKPQSDELARLDAFYRQISQMDGSSSWTIQPLWEAWERQHKQTLQAIRHVEWLAEARENMVTGEYEIAQGLLDHILAEDGTHTVAKIERDLVIQLDALKKAALQAQSDGDHKAEINELEAVLRLDNQAKWASTRLSAVRSELNQREEIERILTAARQFLTSGVYDSVIETLDRLKNAPGELSPEQARNADEIRRQAQLEVRQAANIRKWRGEAREALKRCELQEAITLAAQVLALRPGDEGAGNIRDWARLVQTHLDKARDQLQAEDFSGAEISLKTAKRVGPGISGEEIDQLLSDVVKLRSENQAASESLQQAESAKESGDWVRALQSVMPALDKIAGNPEYQANRIGLEELRDEAVSALQRIIRGALNKVEPDDGEIVAAQAALRALQAYPQYLDAVSRSADSAFLVAQRILQARTLLKQQQPAEAKELLKPYETEVKTRQFLAAYNAVRFADFLFTARQLVFDQTASVRALQESIENLEEAQRLRGTLEGTLDVYRATHWEKLALPDGTSTLPAWLSALRERELQLLIREAIDSGRLNDMNSPDGTFKKGAKAMLNDLSPSSVKEALLSEIRQIEGYMAEASNWNQTPEKTRLVAQNCRALLPPLRAPAYPPAQELLSSIWSKLRADAADMAEANDIEKLAQAVEGYDLLIELAPPELAIVQDARREARKNLMKELDSIEDSVQGALIDADLDKANCDRLLDKVRRIPSRWLNERSILKDAEAQLKERSSHIGKVNSCLSVARSALEPNSPTHRRGSYNEDVEQHLQRAISVNPDVFGRRCEIIALRQTVQTHLSQRKLLEQEVKPLYERAKAMARKGLTNLDEENKAVWREFENRYSVTRDLELISGDATSVKAFVQQGGQWLEMVGEFNRQWKREDPKNIYGLRPGIRDSGEADYLDQEHTRLAKQKEEIDRLGQEIVSALELFEQAKTLAQGAQEELDKAVRDEQLQAAQDKWSQAKAKYDEATTRLTLGAKGTFWSAKLVDLQREMRSHFELKKSEVLKKQQGTMNSLGLLREARREAQRQQANCGHQDAACLKLAIDAWDAVKRLNPKDEEAESCIHELNREVERISSKRHRRRIVWGVTVLVALATAICGFLYFAQIGPFRPTPTPTIPANPAGISTVPEMRATAFATTALVDIQSPSPTMIIVPTAMVRVTSTPISSPLTCVASESGIMRAKPSDSGLGLRMIEPEMALLVIEKKFTAEDGDWYHVRTTFGEDGYIRANLLQCPNNG